MEKKSWVAVGVLALLVIVGVAIVSSSRTDNPVPLDTLTQPVGTGLQQAPSTETSYTLAQVNAHASENDCWTTMNGLVYNITPYVHRHPGGVEEILTVCGRDGAAFFEQQHGGDRRPESMLASLKIGVLAK